MAQIEPGAIPEIAFTLAHGQNQFFVELAEAICDELEQLGVSAGIHVGAYPLPRTGLVHVFLPPHEYVALTGLAIPPALLKRSIVLSAEQPASPFFLGNLALAREAGAVFDINRRSVRAYASHGVSAAHFQLGHTRTWDCRQTDGQRDIDVLFFGRYTTRRARALASYADIFEGFRCHLLLSDNSAPNTATGASFVVGDDKRRLLSRAKVVLNIHGDDEPYFEWLRVIEAVCAGCAVVTEHSTDISPLECGRHLLAGRIGSLGLLCSSLLRDDRRREALAEAAYSAVSDIPLSASVRMIATAAARVDRSPIDLNLELTARSQITRHQPLSGSQVRQPPPRVAVSDGEATALRALKNQQLTLAGLRRRLERMELALNDRPCGPLNGSPITSPAWRDDHTAQLTVITPLYNHAGEIGKALDSLDASIRQDWEVVIIDDGSTDDSLESATRWTEAHPSRACCLVSHSFNRGLAAARNTGISHARTDRLLMLDADNELRPIAMDRLMNALDRDPKAAFAWGIMEQFNADGPVGLLSAFGWEPERFRSGNYIDAFSLIRRSAIEALGGYSGDSRLYGWEDYDLWVRMAESGRYGVFVPEIIARYRVGASSMITHTNVSAVDAFAAIADHAPRLMCGLELPR